ncbi:hypothetical protein QYF36_007590 [Acer negundo]|nr:hypothetical protein QYF36_007590 [Acer negundo]
MVDLERDLVAKSTKSHVHVCNEVVDEHNSANSRNLTDGEERARIFFQSIKTDLYDIAFRLLTEANGLAVTRDTDYDTALHVLARKPPSIFAEGSLALMFAKYLWQSYCYLRKLKRSCMFH